jgi:uncharacterized protein
MTDSKRPAARPGPPEITDNLEERRYEARVDGELVGIVEYGRVQGRLVALHTEVPPEFGGRGIASALVKHVLAEARADGVKITPRCPFFVAHFERHPEDHDLLARPLRRREDEPAG